MPKAAIFDIDGTLINSVDLHARAWQEALAEFGHDVAFEQVRRQIGKGGDQLIPAFLSEAEQKDHGQDMEEWRGTLFKSSYLQLIRPFSAVPELLQRVRDAGLKIAVASSANASELKAYLEIAGITELIDGATSSADAAKFEAGTGHLPRGAEETWAQWGGDCRGRRYALRCDSGWQSFDPDDWRAVRRLRRTRASRGRLRCRVSRPGRVARLLRGFATRHIAGARRAVCCIAILRIRYP